MCATPRTLEPATGGTGGASFRPPGLAFGLCTLGGICTFLMAFGINFSNGRPMSPEAHQTISWIGIAGLILGPIIGASIEASR